MSISDLSGASQVQLDMSKTTKLECECGNDKYKQSYMIRKLSALVSPTGQEALIPIQVFMCEKCGVIPEELQKELNLDMD